MMSIILSEKITDNVFGAVWLAALILTYEEKVIKKSNRIFFDQVEIKKLAQSLCTKTVQSARISQWCNGDHPDCSYNYLRAKDSKRRLTQIGEFNNSKEYPDRLLKAEDEIFEIKENGKKLKYGELFEWYCSIYSKVTNLPVTNDPDSTLEDLGDQGDISMEDLQEDEIKNILANYLNDHGWQTQLAMGKIHGIDIEAYKGKERWIIEVKGCGSRQAMRVNYFLAILGETLQRMSDPNAKYSIALPDMQQYRNLWDRLPRLAKERTGITALFINKDKQIEELK